MKIKMFLPLFFFFIVIYPSNFILGEIAIEHDDFDNTTRIMSYFGTISPWGFFYLQKKNGKLISVFSMVESDWWFFKEPVDIKIDGIIYKNKCEHTESNMIKGGLLMTGCFIDMDQIKEKISKSSIIIFRFYFKNQGALIWEVPNNVLEEWKEVIIK